MYVYVIMKIIHTQTNKTRSLLRKYNIFFFFLAKARWNSTELVYTNDLFLSWNSR